MPLVVGRQQSFDVPYWPGAGPLFYEGDKNMLDERKIRFCSRQCPLTYFIDVLIWALVKWKLQI